MDKHRLCFQRADLEWRPTGADQRADLRVDVTPPPGVVMSLIASNSSPLHELVRLCRAARPERFRVYLSARFNSVSGLTAVSSLGSAARDSLMADFRLDQPYYAAVVGVITPAIVCRRSPRWPLPSEFRAAASAGSGRGCRSFFGAGFGGTVMIQARSSVLRFQAVYQTSGFASVSGLTPNKRSASARARPD